MYYQTAYTALSYLQELKTENMNPFPILNRTTQAAAASAPVSAPSYRQLEEAINKWTLELEEQEKVHNLI